MGWNPAWPRLREFRGRSLSQVLLPLGGIGTGTVSLAGNGGLRDFEIQNHPAKALQPGGSGIGRGAFLAIRAAEGRPAFQCALEGPLQSSLGGWIGSPIPNAGLPRFEANDFAAAYPLAQVRLWDAAAPVAARVDAFNPLVPADPAASGLPFLSLRVTVESRCPEPLNVTVAANLPNFAGADPSEFAAGPHASDSSTSPRGELRSGGSIRGVLMSGEGSHAIDPASGSLALATTHAGRVTYRTGWRKWGWWQECLDMWDDLLQDGVFEDPSPVEPTISAASLGAALDLEPGAVGEVGFLLAWHFPNRYAWSAEGAIGNHYGTLFRDAWEVAAFAADHLAGLEAGTVEFVDAVVASDLPLEVRESALNNLIPLRSETCFRSEDGVLRGWEGCTDTVGCCHGSCTHVWNYELVTPFLFGELACGMRELEFTQAVDEVGLMSFRVGLPASHARDWRLAAADGQMGSVVRLYREWRFSGDRDLLLRTWPGAKRALEFAWRPGGWDGDRDGIMEGCQHNTMDVEYYGPNPEVGLWYLAALAAAAEMADAVGDANFGDECRTLRRRGSEELDRMLFNGEYYEHIPLAAPDPSQVQRGLSVSPSGVPAPEPGAELASQVGPGCLTGQLAGQLAASLAGLGSLVDPDHLRSALVAIHHYNFTSRLRGHYNSVRSYAVDGEAGTVVCTYPRGGRPRRPFPYWSEVWSGLEYTAAAGMALAGLESEAVDLVTGVRSRHNGSTRNPFDEPECGHHYVRAMAAWALIPAMTGFGWSAVDNRIEFSCASRASTWFWSTGWAYGVIAQAPGHGAISVDLEVKGGRLAVKRLVLRTFGTAEFALRELKAGDHLRLEIARSIRDHIE